jgi:uncharacterized protein (TIGR02300 family)
MAKPELGSKRACVSCSARFYDLTRAPAVCPKCGAEQPPEPVRAMRAARGTAPDRRFRKAEPAPAHAEAELDGPVVQESDDEAEDAADEDDAATDEEDEEADLAPTPLG